MIVRNHSFKYHNQITLLESGDPYFNKLEQLIDEATFSIHIQVYIFNNDITGKRVIEKLIAAKERGVEVYLVVDAYASKDFNLKLTTYLRNNGLWVKTFAPLHLNKFKIGRRLHHKIVLVDECIALVGGINIANHYSGKDGQTPWLDTAVCVSGPIIHDIKKLVVAIWPKRVRKKWSKHIELHKALMGDKQLKLLQNDWWRRRIEISSTYNSVIRRAGSDLTIVVSYFLPGYTKRRLLKKAAQRGVNITLITGNDSDIPFMTPAVKYLYGILLKNNVTIYEWNKSVLHSKMAMADGNWVTVGSYNVNALSDFGSLEANIEISDDEFGKQSKQFLDNIIATGCTKVNAEHFFKTNNIIKQAYRWACYKLMRVLLFILFALMRRDRLK
jgi:cardiolipin synthase